VLFVFFSLFVYTHTLSQSQEQKKKHTQVMNFPTSNDYNAGNKLKYGLNLVKPASDSDSDDSDNDDTQQQTKQSNVTLLYDESTASNAGDVEKSVPMLPPPPSTKKTTPVAVDKYEVPFWSPDTRFLIVSYFCLDFCVVTSLNLFSVHPWQLEVIKEGVEMPPMSLANKGYYVVG
jgi:hypothetical protein